MQVLRKDLLANAQSMAKMKVPEVKEVVRYLNIHLITRSIDIKVNQRKAELINDLSRVLGSESSVEVKKIKRIRKVESLRSACIKSIAKVPKTVLVIARAVFEFPHKLAVWKSKSPVSDDVKVLGAEPEE